MGFFRSSSKRQARHKPSALPKKEGGFKAWRAAIDWERVRFRIVGALFILVWLALWARAGVIQLWDGPFLAERARRQHMAAELVSTPRGAILDRNGAILARSVECRSVYANPGSVEDVEATAQTLAGLLQDDPKRIREALEKKRSFIWISRRVDDATAEAVRQANLTGIGLSREYLRIYPFRQAAGQLLGFVSIDGKGLEGLERAFDDRLSGLATRQVVRRDASGRRFYSGEDDPAPKAEDIQLTLDLQIQFIAEDVLARAVDREGAKWGGVLVADTESGEILAWAQYPFFNPNAFREYPAAVYRNRLALDALEPGSTFKPFLIASALEEKVVNPDTLINCENGIWKSKTITIRDDNRVYGEMPVHKVLSLSSNIGCAKIGLTLGPARFYQYLSSLGFGQHSALPLSESRGILRKPRDWSEADVISSSFGQSLSVTIVQMAQGYMALANEGLYKPLRLELGDDVQGGNQRLFSGRAVKDVLAMMRETVESGTGKRAAIPGVAVAGKTGTAQKADKTGTYGKERTASFVGMVPADKPQYLVIVFLDEPSRAKYGGFIAAPVFQEVTSRLLAYQGDLPDAGKVTEAPKKTPPKRKTRAQLAKAQEPTTLGEMRQELIMRPLSGAQPGVVPDVVGKSVRRAVEMFARQGMVPVIRGAGDVVVKQEPAAGASLKAADAPPCVIWLSEK